MRARNRAEAGLAAAVAGGAGGPVVAAGGAPLSGVSTGVQLPAAARAPTSASAPPPCPEGAPVALTFGEGAGASTGAILEGRGSRRGSATSDSRSPGSAATSVRRRTPASWPVRTTTGGAATVAASRAASRRARCALAPHGFGSAPAPAEPDQHRWVYRGGAQRRWSRATRTRAGYRRFRRMQPVHARPCCAFPVPGLPGRCTGGRTTRLLRPRARFELGATRWKSTALNRRYPGSRKERSPTGEVTRNPHILAAPPGANYSRSPDGSPSRGPGLSGSRSGR
jgi:hypothetical protein